MQLFKNVLQALLPPILLQLLYRYHLEAPILRKSEAIVSTGHAAKWIIRFHQLADHAGFWQPC